MEGKGTTTFALRIRGSDEGILFASDTRITIGTEDDKIRVVHDYEIKMFQFTDRIYGLYAGDVRDANYVSHRVHNSLRLRAQHGMGTTVEDVASIISWVLFHEEKLNQFIVGGWDSQKGWQIYNVIPYYKFTESDYTFGGAGPYFAEDAYITMKRPIPKTCTEAKEIAHSVMKAAFENPESYSGGSVNIFTVTENVKNDQIFLPSGDILDGRHWGL